MGSARQSFSAVLSQFIQPWLAGMVKTMLLRGKHGPLSSSSFDPSPLKGLDAYVHVCFKYATLLGNRLNYRRKKSPGSGFSNSLFDWPICPVFLD